MSRISRSKLAKAYVSMLDTKDTSKLNAALAEMVVKGRLAGELDLLLRDINRELLAHRGHLEAEVVSARVLSKDIMSEIRVMLAGVTGAKTVAVQTAQEPSLLGGVLVKTPEMEIDLSIRSSLERLEV